MQNVNWTMIIFAGIVTIMAWLFIPSPFKDKCPAVGEIIPNDTTHALATTAQHTIKIVQEKHKPKEVNSVISTTGSSVTFEKVLTFGLDSTIIIPEDTSWVISKENISDTLGYIIRKQQEIPIRTTTYFFPSDTTYQTILEVGLQPHQMDIHMIRTFEMEKVEEIKPLSILESPTLWATTGAVIGYALGSAVTGGIGALAGIVISETIIRLRR